MLDSAIESQFFMKGITRDTLSQDRKTIQAVIRNIEIIGEAASKLSKDYTNKYPDIPWKQIIGMRNWLIHAYFDIDYDHIWNTVKEDLPILIPKLMKILED